MTDPQGDGIPVAGGWLDPGMGEETSGEASDVSDRLAMLQDQADRIEGKLERVTRLLAERESRPPVLRDDRVAG